MKALACSHKLREHRPFPRCMDAGFSLVELLVVISVIAVIAAIAIPNLGSIAKNAHFAKAQKNAQALAAMGASARAAGYTNNWVSVTNAVAVLTADDGQGISLSLPGGTVQLGVSGLTPDEITEASGYLSIQTDAPDILLYSGGVPQSE